mmetsp:Transcript_166447/g.534731  ORF Transcript_166447/g.534731 Transcript_166447/m.534731 type:complete len:238 (+) Transcript_166447:331-1044(+)
MNSLTCRHYLGSPCWRQRRLRRPPPVPRPPPARPPSGRWRSHPRARPARTARRSGSPRRAPPSTRRRRHSASRSSPSRRFARRQGAARRRARAASTRPWTSGCCGATAGRRSSAFSPGHGPCGSTGTCPAGSAPADSAAPKPQRPMPRRRGTTHLLASRRSRRCFEGPLFSKLCLTPQRPSRTASRLLPPTTPTRPSHWQRTRARPRRRHRQIWRGSATSAASARQDARARPSPSSR